MKNFIDKTSNAEGTPLNRASMMALQGFIAKTTEFLPNKIVETNADGDVLTVTFGNDQITEVFTSGTSSLVKTTSFSENQIIERISE